jgi:hypothetical protein
MPVTSPSVYFASALLLAAIVGALGAPDPVVVTVFVLSWFGLRQGTAQPRRVRGVDRRLDEAAMITAEGG